VRSSPDDLPPRVARGLLWAALGLLFFIRLMSGLDRHDGWVAPLLAAAPYPPLVVLLARDFRPRVRYGLVAAVGLLGLAPFLLLGTDWDWMPWPLAAAVLCALPARAAWPILGLILAATGAAAALLGYGVYLSIWYMIVTADDALIVFGPAALAGLVARLHATRDELARLALVGERARLDAELRAALGGNLRAIAFRIRRAAGAQPEAARQDLCAATEFARHTMAEIRSTAGGRRTDSTPQSSAHSPPPIDSPRLAFLVLLAVLLIQCVLVVINIVYYEPVAPWVLVLAVTLLIAIVIAQVLPQNRITFAVQALLILLPLLAGLLSWDRILSFLTGKVLLTLRPPVSWVIAAFLMAWHAFLEFRDGTTGINAVVLITGHAVIAWLVYCMGRLVELVAALDRARHEIARATVLSERIRVGRDLHDILGFHLSAVALKGELAARLMTEDPDRARAELSALSDLVQRTLVELGSITDDRVELRLAAEVEAARELLATAGVQLRTRVETGVLSASLDTALATVLRETVTNVLRHSQAETCVVTVTETAGAIRLRVVNDGATPAPPGPRGSGLESLARRAGGLLVAGHRQGGRFEVAAEFRSDPTGLGGDPDGVDAVASA
jgi:two-component system sensor histidine kinase DesK